jgi:hypothetical protein
MNTIVVATAAALAVASANAQSPSAAQTPQAIPTSAIPEKIPANWSANGWDQAGWTALRKHCVALFDEVAASQKMSAEQTKALPPFTHSD